MNNKIVKKVSDRLGCEMYSIHHDSGLDILVYPMPDYGSTYAIFGTRYGSVDNCFCIDGDDDFVTVPDGIAHFLEHKLFENEECDAFARYAKTGADANAYTSFDKTCYLFSCTDNFEQSLEILLDFVTSPYFTAETVQKEQGIIGQEIRMYDDLPSWQLFFGAIKALYKNLSVTADIAGTVESIAQITPEHLYRCYNTFYSLDNMVLCVSGNVTPEQVLAVADKVLKKGKRVERQRKYADEPETVNQKRLVKHFPVPTPLFTIGYKEKYTSAIKESDEAFSEILIELLCGKTSPLFRKLLDDELVNERFGGEFFHGPGYRSLLFTGESKNPEAVKKALDDQIELLKTEGVNSADFERARRLVYGRLIKMLETADDTANLAADCYFGGRDIFTLIDTVATASPSDIDERLALINTEHSAISIVEQEV